RRGSAAPTIAADRSNKRSKATRGHAREARMTVCPGRSPQDFARKLEVAEGVDRLAVHAHLEGQVGAEAIAGAPDGADPLALRHVASRAHGDRGLVAVRSRKAVPVVDDREISIAALPTGEDDGSGGCGPDRRSGGHADVDPRMERAVAVAQAPRSERARDRA